MILFLPVELAHHRLTRSTMPISQAFISLAVWPSCQLWDRPSPLRLGVRVEALRTICTLGVCGSTAFASINIVLPSSNASRMARAGTLPVASSRQRKLRPSATRTCHLLGLMDAWRRSRAYSVGLGGSRAHTSTDGCGEGEVENSFLCLFQRAMIRWLFVPGNRPTFPKRGCPCNRSRRVWLFTLGATEPSCALGLAVIGAS